MSAPSAERWSSASAEPSASRRARSIVGDAHTASLGMGALVTIHRMSSGTPAGERRAAIGLPFGDGGDHRGVAPEHLLFAEERREIEPVALRSARCAERGNRCTTRDRPMRRARQPNRAGDASRRIRAHEERGAIRLLRRAHAPEEQRCSALDRANAQSAGGSHARSTSPRASLSSSSLYDWVTTSSAWDPAARASADSACARILARSSPAAIGPTPNRKTPMDRAYPMT